MTPISPALPIGRAFCAEKFGLLKDELCCFVLQIGWVPMLPEYTFDQDLNLGASAFAQSPVDGYALANLSHQFSPNDFKTVFAQDF
jgi:hypothetical protein